MFLQCYKDFHNGTCQRHKQEPTCGQEAHACQAKLYTLMSLHLKRLYLSIVNSFNPQIAQNCQRNGPFCDFGRSEPKLWLFVHSFVCFFVAYCKRSLTYNNITENATTQSVFLHATPGEQAAQRLLLYSSHLLIVDSS